jgi:hypothetical protein
VCKLTDIHGYLDIRWVCIWSDIHVHGYFHVRGKVRLIDLDLDLFLQYPSKPAPLPSRVTHRGIPRTTHPALPRGWFRQAGRCGVGASEMTTTAYGGRSSSQPRDRDNCQEPAEEAMAPACRP